MCAEKKKDVQLAGEGLNIKIGRMAERGVSRFGKRKRGKSEREVLRGHEFDKDGNLMKKERIIDKPNDRYFEFVMNEDTGEVVRHIDEPLSKHVQRGSAKTKK